MGDEEGKINKKIDLKNRTNLQKPWYSNWIYR